jgi:CTP-dependent riboflavin kinase
VLLVGEVCAGFGAASRDVRNGVYPAALLGFTPYPGTLNLRTDPGVLAGVGDPYVINGPECPLWLWPAMIGDRRVWVMHPDRHPPVEQATLCEILADVSLRDKLGVQDGDTVKVRL